MFILRDHIRQLNLWVLNFKTIEMAATARWSLLQLLLSRSVTPCYRYETHIYVYVYRRRKNIPTMIYDNVVCVDFFLS